jgi:hypothetical protein
LGVGGRCSQPHGVLTKRGATGRRRFRRPALVRMQNAPTSPLASRLSPLASRLSPRISVDSPAAIGGFVINGPGRARGRRFGAKAADARPGPVRSEPPDSFAQGDSVGAPDRRFASKSAVGGGERPGRYPTRPRDLKSQARELPRDLPAPGRTDPLIARLGEGAETDFPACANVRRSGPSPALDGGGASPAEWLPRAVGRAVAGAHQAMGPGRARRWRAGQDRREAGRKQKWPPEGGHS